MTLWAGGQWFAVSSGVNNHVGALIADGSRLYVGGAFAQVCGNSPCKSGNQTVNRIARWNGIGWSSFAVGMNNEVWVLAVKGSEVCAGSYLSAICGKALRFLKGGFPCLQAQNSSFGERAKALLIPFDWIVFAAL